MSACLCAQPLQSCVTLCDHMNCSPPGSSVREICRVRILEWVAVSSSRGPSPPKNRTPVICISCTAGRFFTTSTMRKACIGVMAALLRLGGCSGKWMQALASMFICPCWWRYMREIAQVMCYMVGAMHRIESV